MRRSCIVWPILVPRGHAPFGQHQESRPLSQRSRFLVLTKRSAASGDENEFGPDSILLKSWVFHHECMECKECYFLTRITLNIWTLDHVKVMHSSCADQSSPSSLARPLRGLTYSTLKFMWSLARPLRGLAYSTLKFMRSTCGKSTTNPNRACQLGFDLSVHVVALYAISRPYSVLIESGNCSYLTSIAERQNCLPLSWQAHSVRSRSLIS